LTSSSPELRKAIDTCVAARQPILANTMWLVLGDRFIEEGQPRKTLALLERIGPGIHASDYYAHLLSSQVQRARANEKLGNVEDARKAALAALAMGDDTEVSEWRRDAYGVLYRIENCRITNAMSPRTRVTWTTSRRGTSRSN
jgi:hypothetical protein